MSIKVGILTFHKSINYGSVLQSWATLDLLKKQGYNAEIIDYEPSKYKYMYSTYMRGKSKNVIKRNIFRIPIANYIRHQKKLFEYFRSTNLILSNDHFSHEDDLKKWEDKYDCILCGSDQIWNVHAGDCDDEFFLPNVDTKKIAFSVSVNNTDFSESRCDDNLKKWIQDFDFISCREASGARKISDFINGRNVETFLDPTLMHNKEDYENICGERIINGDYIFLYKVWSGMDSYKLVSEIGKLLNMPIYMLLTSGTNCQMLCNISKTGIRVIKKQTGPSDYLSLIKNANYVVTDSFHGTAFSIIFEKKFFCVKEKQKDGQDLIDERIDNILNTLGLAERYISLDELNKIDMEKAIDYTYTTNKRLEIAKSNIKLLNEAINSPRRKGTN